MTKRQLIDEIVSLNHSAEPGFLARFQDDDLDEYLHHLQQARTPRLNGDPHRFDHYFDGCPTVAAVPVATLLAVEPQDEPTPQEELVFQVADEQAEEIEDPIAQDEPMAEIEQDDAEPEPLSLDVHEAAEEPAPGRPQWRAGEPSLAFDPHVDPAASFAPSYEDEDEEQDEDEPVDAFAAPAAPAVEQEEEKQAYLF